MRTPLAVKKAAKFLTDDFATKYCHLGQYNGYEVYTLEFLEDVTIGFPWVFLYKEGEDVISLNDERFVFDIIETAERRKAARLAKEQSNLNDRECFKLFTGSEHIIKTKHQ